MRVHAASINARDWHVMRGQPRLAPIIDRRFRLEDAADAIRYMEVHHASGKVVITTT